MIFAVKRKGEQMRAIDVLKYLLEKAESETPEGHRIIGVNVPVDIVREIIDAQPERKTGEWIELTNTNHTYICSICGRMLVNITEGKNNVTKSYPFCHCGADMRGTWNEKCR